MRHACERQAFFFGEGVLCSLEDAAAFALFSASWRKARTSKRSLLGSSRAFFFKRRRRRSALRSSFRTFALYLFKASLFTFRSVILQARPCFRIPAAAARAAWSSSPESAPERLPASSPADASPSAALAGCPLEPCSLPRPGDSAMAPKRKLLNRVLPNPRRQRHA